MKTMRFYFYVVSILTVSVLTLSTSGCKKPLSFSDENLSFSVDTLVFDTVFTTIGSTTKRLKIYNNDSKVLKIESIELEGGANSPYRINVDGLSGLAFSDIELEPNDSLFIFVEVTLNPNNLTNPLVIEDRIRFRTNGNDQYVRLMAWGQDAYFHYSDYSIPNGGGLDINSGVWPNDKPHVILNAAFIDSAETLTIPAGTDIYLHKNAYLFNYKGTLNINGTLSQPVTFQGDRLEQYYDDVQGQYYGIYFKEARPSIIDYAIIKNGITGIHVESRDDAFNDYTVKVSNTIIENNASYGMLLFQGAKVKAENCILSHNGIHSLVVIGGADFNFNHCDILGYGNGQNVSAAVGISNWYYNPQSQTTEVSDINEGKMTNCAIYGNLDYELAIDTISLTGVNITLDFRRNLIRSETVFTNGFANDNLWNQDPWFYDTAERDFHLWGVSPMNNAGDSNFPVTLGITPNTDIEGKPRNGPDIGAYEVN